LRSTSASWRIRHSGHHWATRSSTAPYGPSSTGSGIPTRSSTGTRTGRRCWTPPGPSYARQYPYGGLPAATTSRLSCSSPSPSSLRSSPRNAVARSSPRHADSRCRRFPAD